MLYQGLLRPSRRALSTPTSQGTTSTQKFRIAEKKPIGCAKCHLSRMIVGTHKRCPIDTRSSKNIPGGGEFSLCRSIQEE